jgi:hypothetical protein
METSPRNGYYNKNMSWGSQLQKYEQLYLLVFEQI